MFVAILLLSFVGCGGDGDSDPVSPDTTTKSDCVGCHTDKDMLVATAEEDTTTSGGDTGET